MKTTREDMHGWIVNAIANEQKYLIVACDTFDYEDYPVPCATAEECLDKFDKYNNKNMQSIMEVYDLSLPIDEQLNERRAFHLPEAKPSPPTDKEIDDD